LRRRDVRQQGGSIGNADPGNAITQKCNQAIRYDESVELLIALVE
jgi:hypothetical protein